MALLTDSDGGLITDGSEPPLPNIPGRSDTDICNLALAELPDKPIASMSEASLQARECRRVYQPAVLEFFERHPWQFANQRVSLAEAAQNDRSGEWQFVYQAPVGIGSIGKIVFAQPDTTDSEFLLVGQRLAPSGQNLWERAPGQPYLRSGPFIYTDVPTAVLEYRAAILPEDRFPALFVKALYFDIASRICTPLSRSADKKKELIAQAELWWGRATAADLNGQMNSYDPLPDAVRANA